MPVRHVLKAGECLQSLALSYGFKDGKTLYDAPDNADLRSKRSSPEEVAPGDVVMVPDRKKRDVSVALGKANKFACKTPAGVLRVHVCDEAGKPLASKPYALSLKGKKLEGTTSSDGLVEQPVPMKATAATLVVYDTASKDEGRWTWTLRVASLDAPETPTGAWQRLANLGYWSPAEQAPSGTAPDANAVDPLAMAIRAFQHDEQLDESGRLDDPTRARLVQRHGL